MESSSPAPVQTLLVTIGSILLAAALNSWLTSDKRFNTGIFIVGLVGLIAVCLGTLWQKIDRLLPDSLVKSALEYSSDFRSWLILLLSVVAYAFVVTVQYNDMARVMRDEILPFQLLVQKFVLPRIIEEQKIASIGKYLAAYPPERVDMIVNLYDDEASHYAQHIRNAIHEGNWIVRYVNYESDMQLGLQYDLRTPTDASDEIKERGKEALRILSTAFREAGVPFGRGSSGGDPDATDYILTIRVGARRRGPNAPVQSLRNESD